jgi:hypothetical protein
MGISVNGYETAIEELITKVLCLNFATLTYVEIGVAHGGTLGAIADIMRGVSEKWRAVGVELPNGYSYDEGEVKRNMYGRHLTGSVVYDTKAPVDPPWKQVTVYLTDSRVFLSEFWRQPVHLALIDGCHCRECASKDFANIEDCVVPGGYVMFHDFGEDQIGQHQELQTGDHRQLDVRGACQQLGLLDGTRAGWEFVGELIGDKTRAGANMGVFKKLGAQKVQTSIIRVYLR